MPLFGGHEDKVAARALILTISTPPGGGYSHHVTMAVEVPGAGPVPASALWLLEKDRAAILGPGSWVPVRVAAGKPGEPELIAESVPTAEEFSAAVTEALGGPPVPPREPDEWRIALALQHVETVIARAGLEPTQAEAIRTRLRRGV